MAVTLPAQAANPVCVKAAAAWPASVSGRTTVATDPADPAVHAWGDPAIVARCGVAAPGPTTDDCLTVNGVDWVATPLSDGTRFVTYGRDPAVEVLIPKGGRPGGFAAAGVHRRRPGAARDRPPLQLTGQRRPRGRCSASVTSSSMSSG